MKPTKAQQWALTLLPVEASLDRYGYFFERIAANGKSIGVVRQLRRATLDGLVQRGLAKKIAITETRWRYEAAA